MSLWKGIVTALITPYKENYEICRECIKELVEYQLSNGVSGLFIMGTYGEGFVMGLRQRKEFMKEVINYVPSKTVVLPHIATSDIEASLELARYAKDLGYRVVSSVGPIYYKSTKRGIIEYFKYLSKADVDIVIYNNAGRQRYNITPQLFEEIVHEVPSVIGVKDTSYSVEQLLEYVARFKGKYFIAAGGDSMLLYTFVVGADAHICGISNVFPRQAYELYRAVVEGNLEKARKIQEFVDRFRSIIGKFGLETPEVLREILKFKGINAGYPNKFIGWLDENEKIELKKLIEPYLNIV